MSSCLEKILKATKQRKKNPKDVSSDVLSNFVV